MATESRGNITGRNLGQQPSPGADRGQARQRRKRDPEGTRRRLLEAAKREFAARGLDGARVHKIARQAGVNKQLVYYYFGNKELIFVAVLEEAYGQIRARDAVATDNLRPEAAIAALVKSIFDGIAELQDEVALIVEANRHKGRHVRRSEKIPQIHRPLVIALRTILRRGEEIGVFRHGVDPVRFFISVVGMCSTYISNSYTLSAVFDRDLRQASEMKAWRRYVVDAALRMIRSTAARGARRPLKQGPEACTD